MPEPNGFIRTMLARRCVRSYTQTPVPREAIIQMVRAGMSAPSYKDARHRHFIVVDDPVLIDKLGEGLPFSKMLLTARHAIIVASDQALLPVAIAETDYWVQDCAVAGENILLAGHSMGIATCWTAAHPRAERADFVKKTLHIPEHIKVLCVIAVGMGSGEEPPRDKFEPDKIFWNAWGQAD